MSDELLPCPFCGGTAEMVESTYEAAWYTVCLQCSCQIGTYSSRLDMVPDWNKRMPNVAALERIAELEAQLAELQPPKQVRLVLLACVREVIDAEGMTPALAAARDWLKEAKGAGNG